MKKTLDQYRAGWAWTQTKAIVDQNWFDKYVALAEGTSATILMCGLGQTVAFYLSKGEPHHEALLANVASWLLHGHTQPNQTPHATRSGRHLIDEITDNSRDRYHQLTDEVLVYLIWLKRFAKAMKG